FEILKSDIRHLLVSLRLLLRGPLARLVLARRLVRSRHPLGSFSLRRHTFRARRSCCSTTLPALALRQFRRLGCDRFAVAVPRRFRLGTRIVREQNRDVTKVALLTIGPALRSGTHAASALGRSAIDEGGLHPKIVRIDGHV